MGELTAVAEEDSQPEACADDELVDEAALGGREADMDDSYWLPSRAGRRSLLPLGALLVLFVLFGAPQNEASAVSLEPPRDDAERSPAQASTGPMPLRSLSSAPAVQPPTVSYREKMMCFTHVGRCGGGTFRATFAQGRRSLPSPKLFPGSKGWREFHVFVRINETWLEQCDMWFAVVGHPVTRGVAAIWLSMRDARRSADGVADGVAKYEIPNRFAELISESPQARKDFAKTAHVKYNIAYYFNNGTLLDDPRFRERLVFVGAQECLMSDMERFAKLLGVEMPRVRTEHREPERLRAKHENISGRAEQNLREFFRDDFSTLRRLLPWIQCNELRQALA